MTTKTRRLTKLQRDLDQNGDILTQGFSPELITSVAATSYNTPDDLPGVNVAGSLALVQSNDTLYFNDGNGWYAVSKYSS